MKRHYFVSDDLDELVDVERDLERRGLTVPQIHVLSDDEAGVANRQLNEVEAVLRKDVVRLTEKGAVVGVAGAAAVLVIGYLGGFAATYTWAPTVFFAIAILGFCTWEGGFIGIQRLHHEFSRFQTLLGQGKHVLMVDIQTQQEADLGKVVSAHPALQAAGVGMARPQALMKFQDLWHRFVRWAP